MELRLLIGREIGVTLNLDTGSASWKYVEDVLGPVRTERIARKDGKSVFKPDHGDTIALCDYDSGGVCGC